LACPTPFTYEEAYQKNVPAIAERLGKYVINQLAGVLLLYRERNHG
jgi:hypothetical protein